MTVMPTRILIVEDDPDIADLVARYLDKAGFVTERAANGRDGLGAMAARPPDLMVLDLMLPYVDGLEIVRRGSTKPPPPYRSSCSPRGRRSRSVSSASNSAPTTTWRNRSARTSWSRGCARCCDARSAARRRRAR